MTADANMAVILCTAVRSNMQLQDSQSTLLTRAPLQIQTKPLQPVNGTFAATSLCDINKMDALL